MNDDDKMEEDGQEISQDDHEGEDVVDATKGCKKSKFFSEDIEYGVSRGVDFRGIKNVLNMDFPSSANQYVHRSGRTARGHSAGISLSLVCESDNKVIEDIKVLLGPNQMMTPYAFKVASAPSSFSFSLLTHYTFLCVHLF